MTLKEFLEFISQSSNHFVGFLLVFGITTEFIVRIIQSFNKSKKEK